MKERSIRIILFTLLLVLLGVRSCMVNAQNAQADKNYSYYGYEISLSMPQQVLRSNIPQLDALKVNYFGFNLGGVMANNYGKLKVNAGVYSSESSVPYESNMYQGSVSGNIYLLKLNYQNAHLFEPYGVLGVSQQITEFHGNYLSREPQRVSSLATQPFLGTVSSTKLNVGTGVEFQMQSDNTTFIHLFAEATYGIPVMSFTSNDAFSQTKVTNAMAFTIGINFGISRLRRY